jgi:glycine/D-amino acid oxidase-like deaminating enzyme
VSGGRGGTVLEERVDLAVVGAGAVGVASALWAQKLGLSVAMIDPEPPGRGASFGNAGTIATYACLPVNSPSVLTGLPRLLLSGDSPLRIDPAYALRHLPWMLAFLRNCTPSRVRRITAELARLLEHADAGLDPLIEAAGAGDLVVTNGCLYAYATPADFAAASGDIQARRQNRVAFEVLDGQEVTALEPGIAMPVHRALYFRGARHLADPGAFVERLHAAVLRGGGGEVRAAVRQILPRSDHVEVEFDNGGRIEAGHVVIAAGAHSRRISGSGAEDMPLDTERGYHLMFPAAVGRLQRPVGWGRAGLYATPMTAGLRIAGTVEIAGVDAPPTAARFDYLARMGAQLVGEIGPPGGRWLGFRPTMPDALPVIGLSPRSPRVLLAFGHQHVGLTLSGLTGRLVAGLAAGQPLNLDLSACSPRRFRR